MMAKFGPDQLYLLVDYDNHTDPEYHLFLNLAEALSAARACVEEHVERYGDMPKYETDCSKIKDWHFAEQGEERWQVTVVELPITYKWPATT